MQFCRVQHVQSRELISYVQCSSHARKPCRHLIKLATRLIVLNQKGTTGRKKFSIRLAIENFPRINFFQADNDNQAVR